MQTRATPKIKTVAYLLSLTALLTAVLVYMNTVSMGFPDGHLTEFERAVKPLSIGYSSVGLLFGILFFSLARFLKQTSNHLFFYISLGLFILIVIGTIILYVYFGSNLNHGGGG